MVSLVQAANAATAIHDIESGQIPSVFQDDSDKEWWEKLGPVTLLALGLGSASIVLNILAMIFNGGAVVYAMGIIALLLAPTIMKRQVDMEDKGGMRKVQNKLRENVNDLHNENTKLCKQVNDLADRVQKLKHFETELDEITKESNQDVNALVGLVKENGEIMEEFEKAIIAQAINLVICVFLECDKDESHTLEEKEIRILSFRLGQLEGVVINKELFEQKLTEDPSMAGAIAVLRTSTKKDAKAEDQVFTFFPSQVDQ